MTSLIPRLTRRPVFGLVCCGGFGTWLGSSYAGTATIAGAAIGCLIALSAGVGLSVRRHPAAPAFILCAAMFLGWLNAATHPATAWARIASTPSLREGPVTVVATVREEPELHRSGTDGNGAYSAWCFPVALERIRVGEGAWKRVSGILHVERFGSKWRKPASPGERWRFKGGLAASRRNAGRITLYAEARAHSEGSSMFGRFVAACHASRRYASGQLTQGIEQFDDVTSVVRALILGYRSDLSKSDKRLFAATGTLHIFAISGLHVGIFAGIIIFLLQILRVSRDRWILFLAPLLVGYTIATGARASAVRACVMAIIYFLAPLMGRKGDSVSALAVAAACILAVAPFQLLQPGFIFSFIVVAGLIALFPVFRSPLESLFEWEPLSIEPEPRWHREMRLIIRRAGSVAALSLAAWLVSAPLTAYFFGRFSPVALLGNVFVIPLAFLIVVSGALSFLFGSCVAFLGVAFNHANVALVSLLLSGIRVLANVPGGSIPVTKPPLWAILAWYLLLAILALRASASTRIPSSSPPS